MVSLIAVKRVCGVDAIGDGNSCLCAVDSNKNLVYAINTITKSIYVADMRVGVTVKTFDISSYIGDNYIYGVGFDSVLNVIYVSERNDSGDHVCYVDVVDTKNGVVLRRIKQPYTVGSKNRKYYTCTGVAPDETSNLVFVPQSIDSTYHGVKIHNLDLRSTDELNVKNRDMESYTLNMITLSFDGNKRLLWVGDTENDKQLLFDFHKNVLIATYSNPPGVLSGHNKGMTLDTNRNMYWLCKGLIDDTAGYWICEVR